MIYNAPASVGYTELASHQNRHSLESALDMARNRIMVVMILGLLSFGALGFRLIDISCLREDPERVSHLTARQAALNIQRADILDREGRPLATSIPTASLYADARVMDNIEKNALKINRVLPQVQTDILLEKLRSRKAFVWVARHLTPQQKAEVIKLGIPGLNFVRDERRIYPYGALTSHVIGLSDSDSNGLSGVEHYFDQKLREDQSPLRLSLDVNIQSSLHEILSEGMEHFQAEGANGLIINSGTGEVLASVSLPDLDPHRPTAVQKKKADAAKQEAFFNKNTLGVYEMGSTFKVLNTALALESGAATMHTMFDATKPLKVGHFRVTDYHPEARWMNTGEIFVKSSNIGAAQMALRVGIQGQKAFFEKIGFLEGLDLEITEKARPIYPQKWREANLVTAAYGYGVAITPVQLIAAVGGIVNNGVMMKPTLLKASLAEENRLGQGKRIVSEETSRQIRDLMVQVVEKGTSRKAQVAGYQVGGKTGTSNYRKQKGRGYQKRDVRTSYVGFLGPYVVLVMLHRPKGLSSTHGFNAAGWNAAPIGGKVIRTLASYLGIPPDHQEAQKAQKKLSPIIHRVVFKP